MYTGLIHTHSSLRYLVLVILLTVIIKSFMGWQGKKPFSSADNKLSLVLLILTHIQLVIGLVLYFVSDKVQFNSETMSTAGLRYWAVEHISLMLIAIVLITLARTTSKRLTEATAKHKRLFVLNTLALAIILLAIYMSGRGFFSLPSIG
jgi:cytochrome bd-type quinol oxidase subunit 2